MRTRLLTMFILPSAVVEGLLVEEGWTSSFKSKGSAFVLSPRSKGVHIPYVNGKPTRSLAVCSVTSGSNAPGEEPPGVSRGALVAETHKPTIEEVRDVVETNVANAQQVALKASTVAMDKIKAVPGSGLAGMPKWVDTLRRRLVTKEDLFHLHAASGLIFLVGTSAWILYGLGAELATGVPDLDVSSKVPVFLLGAGLFNVLSSIPMAHTRSWYLAGMASSVAGLWLAWWFSDLYPAWLGNADPWIASAVLAITVISAVETEEDMAVKGRSRKITGGNPPTFMRRKDRSMEIPFQRAAWILNSLNAPPVYAILMAGREGLTRLVEAYPGEQALLFHAHFSLAAGIFVSLLGPTLYSRKLIDSETLIFTQLATAAPLVTSFIDSAVSGGQSTNNLFEIISVLFQ
ncbi:unnamed protein product [Discosporangium mesarthrocarpum]